MKYKLKEQIIYMIFALGFICGFIFGVIAHYMGWYR